MWLKTFKIITALGLLLSRLATAAAPDCDQQISVHCGQTPSVAFTSDGRLWLSFVQGSHVYVTHSDDLARNFSTAVKVNQQPEAIYSDGENRAKIAIGESGQIYLTWSQKTAGRFNGDIRFSRSVDNGKSFSPILTVNDDAAGISQRFDALYVSPAGTVFIAWLDKRNFVAAQQQQQSYSGSAVYFASSNDQGVSFGKNTKVADHSCECCRLAFAGAEDNSAVLLWRQLFNRNTRDHAIARLYPDQQSSAVVRASFDDWQIDACPHHGPAISQAEGSDYHLAWFSNSEKHQGLYYGRFDIEQGRLITSQAMDNSPGASHPQITTAAGQLYYVWKSFDGSNTHLLLSQSSNGGLDWLAPRSIASSSGNSDHPLLVVDQQQGYVSWLTDQGYQLLPLGQAAMARTTQ
jgi:hypothetical protein